MDFDPTCKLSGCFEERPGWIQFNANLMDKGVVGNPLVKRKDDPFEMLKWIEKHYLDPKEEEYKL